MKPPVPAISAAVRAAAASLAAFAVLFALMPSAFAGPKTQAGPYTVELTTDPAVIPVGKAQLIVRITDAAGKPVTGATVRALTKMPTMDMGEREQPGAEEAGQPGIYRVPAQFAMEGGYESSLRIAGPQGTATARIPLQTGENTASAAAGGGGSAALPWVLAALVVAALVAFVLQRLRRTGQTIPWRSLWNRQTLGGLLLLGAIAAGSMVAVDHFRRPGALTPIEAQAMDMSNLPPPPGYAPVTLATVTRGDVASHVTYAGTAVGYVEQDVIPRIAGNLVSVLPYTGDRIRKGQLLARLDTSQTAPQLAEKAAATNTARQGVSVAAAEVDQAQAEVHEAHDELSSKIGAVDEAEAGISAAGEARDDAQAALAAAEAQIADADAQVTAAKADQTYWKAQIARSETLFKAGAVSGEEYQRDRAQADGADAKVQQAEAQRARVHAGVQSAQAARRKADDEIAAANARLQMARAELESHYAHVRAAQAAVEAARRKVAAAQSGAAEAAASEQAAAATQGYAEIRAEADGVVLQRLISPGVLVSPGQAILKVAQIRPIRLQANVAEADLARIRAGSAVTVRGRAGDGRKPLIARITSVAPAVDPVTRTGVVEAVVPNADERFLPGQFVVLDIATGESRGGLRVPSLAIQYRTPDTDGILTTQSQPYVWVADRMGADGQYTVRRTDVTLGMRGDTATEVVSGLAEGQRVVLAGGTYLKEGDSVGEAPPAPNNGGAGSGVGGADYTVQRNAGARRGGGPPIIGGGGGLLQQQRHSEGAESQTASITVTAAGFEPSSLSLKAGVPARITFTRTTNDTCATAVVFPDLNVKKDLPLNQPVTVEFTPKKAGEIGFACGMNMVKGKVVIVP